MKILECIELEELQQLQDAISKAIGVSIMIEDLDGKPIIKSEDFAEFYAEYKKVATEGHPERKETEDGGYIEKWEGILNFKESIMINKQHIGYIVGGIRLTEEMDKENMEQKIFASANLTKTIINDRLELLLATANKGKNKKTLEMLEKMMETSTSIAAKTKELEKISKQQNILSLNASIEAARAGEAGSGFAIVANQMGKLAAQSAEIYTTIIADANGIHDSANTLQHSYEQN